MPGIREVIAKGLGVSREDANALIQGHDPKAIIRNVRKTASNIVKNLPYAEAGYDFKHEVTECGKNRQYNAIVRFGGISKPGPDVSAWSRAVYHVAQNVFAKRAFGNGIEGFREYVKSLPLGGHTLNFTAKALDMDVVKFIAENGDAKDFRLFMTDIRFVKDGKPEVHGCPGELSDRIFSYIRGNIKKFDRDELMSGLGRIHSARNLTDDEKRTVQNEFIKQYLQDAVPTNFFEKLDIGADAAISSLHELSDATEKLNERYSELMREIPMSSSELSELIQKKFSNVFDHGQRKVEINRYNISIYAESGCVRIPAKELIETLRAANKAYAEIADECWAAVTNGKGIRSIEEVRLVIDETSDWDKPGNETGYIVVANMNIDKEKYKGIAGVGEEDVSGTMRYVFCHNEVRVQDNKYFYSDGMIRVRKRSRPVPNVRKILGAVNHGRTEIVSSIELASTVWKTYNNRIAINGCEVLNDSNIIDVCVEENMMGVFDCYCDNPDFFLAAMNNGIVYTSWYDLHL